MGKGNPLGKVLNAIYKPMIGIICKSFDYLSCCDANDDRKLLTKIFINGRIDEAKYQEFCDNCLEDNFEFEKLQDLDTVNEKFTDQ